MSLEDGAECYDDDIDYFFCKEGSGCIPNDKSSTGLAYGKVTTTLDNNKTCDSDSDCPNDSYCECNSMIGKEVCIPYPYARKDTLKYFKKYLELYYKEDVDEEVYKPYEMAIVKTYNPYDSEAMCWDKGFGASVKPFALQAILVFAAIVAMIF